LDGWLKGAHTLEGGEVLRRCPPFDDLFLDLFPNFIQDLLTKLSNYLKSFWDGFNKVVDRGDGSLNEMRTILMLTGWIKALEKIISFLDFWAECTDDLVPDDLDELKEAISGSRAPTNLRNLQNASKIPTISKVNGLDTIKAEELNKFKDEFRKNVEPNKSVPFTTGAIKVLLTNFLGVSQETVDAAIEEVDGDCRCKDGFKPNEIEKIKGLFNK